MVAKIKSNRHLFCYESFWTRFAAKFPKSADKAIWNKAIGLSKIAELYTEFKSVLKVANSSFKKLRPINKKHVVFLLLIVEIFGL
jgi:hypothetical protein